MKYRVIHPFLDKYHPEDIFYPEDIVVVEDAERLHDLMELELLEFCNDNISPYKTLKDKIEEEKNTEAVDTEDLMIEEIKQNLDKKGIKYDKRLSKEKLVKLLEEAE